MTKYVTMLTLFFVFSLSAQITQTVKGTITDEDSEYPLIGAKVELIASDSSTHLVTGTDADGWYRFENVEIGNYILSSSYNSYLTSTRSIIVNSGKESVVNLRMAENITTTDEVEIVGRKAGEVSNEMAMISAQEFSVEETDRYAGSRGDPARMASNFAGVQGADDSRNDIVIRGNSPIGVSWRVEGVDIPNPNHFATSGSTGGPVAILNNKILDNSDFYMSAFPAEYGNAISGVFDLKLRNGNTDKHEFSGQFGFLGTEVMAEGPINKEKKSSYLVMGRYSTLSIFQAMNIKIGTDAVPTYGDGAFRLSFPQKDGSHLAVFGIGGISDIDIMVSDQTEYSEEAFGEGDRDQYFGTAMGIIGVSYKKSFSRNTFFKTTLSQAYDQQHSHHDFLIRSIDSSDAEKNYQIQTDSIYPLMGYAYHNYKTSLYASINHKITKQHIIRAGVNVDAYFINYIDTALDASHSYFYTRDDYKGFVGIMAQPFFQYKWKISDKMDLTAGIHSQYFSMNNSISIAEPRLGWQWRLPKNQTVSAGVGMHSQMQPMYQYMYQQPLGPNGEMERFNQDMDFTRSLHAVVGYQKMFNSGILIKSEAYYQYLYDIPVDTYASSFSLINQGSGFQRFWPDKLVNKGTAENYGVELTVKKRFDNNYYFMFTGSLFESKYKGSDRVERNTDFNGNYAVNFLAGYDWKINAKNKLSFGVKATAAGGRRYGYVDNTQSLIDHELVYLDSLRNTRQFKDYFRLDVKITYTLNTNNFTHELGLDLVNVLNTKNVLALMYSPDLLNPTNEPIATKYQLGFLPIFYYRIDFTFGGKK